MPQFGSAPFSWNKVDTASIKRSAMRAALGLAVAIGTALMAGVNNDSPTGALIAGAIASFGPTLLKAVQRYVSDGSNVVVTDPESFH